MDNNYQSTNYLLSGEYSQLQPFRPLFRDCSNPCLCSAEHSNTPPDDFSFKLGNEGNEFGEDLLRSELCSQPLGNATNLKVFITQSLEQCSTLSFFNPLRS